MQNILKNKKLFATLLAGILLITAALGAGTYAWFSLEDDITGTGEFNAANLQLDTEKFDINVFEFYPGHNDTYGTQKRFEDLNVNDQTAFVNEYNFSKQYFTVINPQDIPLVGGPQAGNCYLIKNAHGKTVDNFVYSVTPGSFLEAKFNFTSHSYVPVYFRIKAVDMKAVDKNDANKQLAMTQPTLTQAIIKDAVVDAAGTIVDITVDLIYDDEWYYCPIPLNPVSGKVIEINSTSYIFGDQNSSKELFAVNFIFGNANGSGKVEIIQATNNAAYFVSGWKNVADKLIPYVESANYSYYTSLLP